jgi:hypothetical protein
MRCKSCDAVMQPEEIIWYEEYKHHEELCAKCLTLMREGEDDEDDWTYLTDEDDIGDWDVPPWEGEDYFK